MSAGSRGLAVFLLLATCPVWAQTVIRIVREPVPGGAARLSGILPASEAFIIEYAEGADIVSATLDIWPLNRAPNCQGSPVGPQHYALAMTPTGSADTLVYRATVPPLQVDTTFCFKVSPRARVSQERFARVAVDAMEQLFSTMLAPGHDCAVSANENAFRVVMTNAAQAQGLPGVHTNTAADIAFSEFNKAGGKKACSEMGAAIDKHAGGQRAAVQQEALRNAARDAVLGLAPLPGPLSPLILWQDKPMQVHRVLATIRTADEVERLVASLAELRKSGDTSNSVEAWHGGLVALVDLLGPINDEPKRRQAINASLKKLMEASAPEAFTFVVDGKLVDARKLPDDWEGLPPKDAREQLEAQEGAGAFRQEHRPLVMQWIAALKAWEQSDSRYDELVEDVVRLAEAETQARATTWKALADAFNSQNVRLVIIEAQTSIALLRESGEGTTPKPANYASVDVGVLVSGPRWGADPWLLPYVGFNLYSVPVDRAVPFRDMVGPGLTRLRQRLSLTIGFTLANPDVTNRTLDGFFLGKFPVVALGWRTSQYTRVSGGAVFYRYDSANPASSDTHLGASAFVGASLDIDLIHLLTKADL